MIEDVPTALWFSYIYLENTGVRIVTQRVKLTALPKKLERLAHVTNHIFSQGYLAPNLRSVVYWQSPCGKRIEEHVRVEDLLASGEGTSEDKPLRFVIGKPGYYCVLVRHNIYLTDSKPASACPEGCRV